MMGGEHWGTQPYDWADLAEPSNEAVFSHVLTLVGAGPGVAVLDLACGSGYAAGMAARLGAHVTGVDITPELLAIARERVPEADFIEGGIDLLPFADATFDVVVGFSAFQFANDPAAAAAEAARVVRPGGLVAAASFAEPERNESTALHLALEPLRASAGPADAGGAAGPPGAGHQHLPYALSGPDGLAELLAGAGLQPVAGGEIPVVWAHRSVDEAVRAVLASGGGAMAIAAAGQDAAAAALTAAVAAFTAADESVRMQNLFRYAVGRRPGVGSGDVASSPT